MNKYKNIIKNAGLKATPQRIYVLEAVCELKNHPSVDDVHDFLKNKNLELPKGTIYNILETFVQNGLMTMLKTDKGRMRFDASTKQHHHIYCKETGSIKDFSDTELDKIIEKYFNEKGIKDFQIDEFKLQIMGRSLQRTNEKKENI